MDVDDLRMVERIMIALFGGLSIYLGYRLFLAVPFAEKSDGEFVIPRIGKLTLARVGPGVFFALFGAAVLAFESFNPITFEEVESLVKSSASPEPTAVAGKRSDEAEAKKMENRIRTMKAAVEAIDGVQSALEPGLDESRLRELKARLEVAKKSVINLMQAELDGLLGRVAEAVKDSKHSFTGVIGN